MSNKPNPARQSPREEPELANEESVPSDGRDVEGEQLMKEVTNRKLHDKGDAEHKTPEKAKKAEKADRSADEHGTDRDSR